MLYLDDLTFQYKFSSPKLLNNLTRKINKGEIVAVNGDSAAGKTTLLNIICGVIPKFVQGNLSGEVFFNDIPISSLSLAETAPYISLLMQHPDNQLFFPTVEQELAFGPENLNIQPNEILKRIYNTLKHLNIEDLRFQETTELSFGQKKLVVFASLLILSPQVLLLDEPFTGISQINIELMKEEIYNQAEMGKIIIVAGHENAKIKASQTIELKQ
ncbi:MAG: energy-coupling factor ABC transporter ATP-binding protein [Candidatus Cloacimonetes bacterium]|nr:energy-coupling factor ABC transporter ATP-binding protein [Candidatus Cloacimonadota bacterium]